MRGGGGGRAAVGISEGDACVNTQIQKKSNCVEMHTGQHGRSAAHAGERE